MEQSTHRTVAMVKYYYQQSRQRRIAKEVADIAKRRYNRCRLRLYCLPDFIRIGRTDTQEALHIEIIPASNEISMTCIQLNIQQTTFGINVPTGLLTEPMVDPQHNLIKGRGGAMFKENCLIKSSDKSYIIIDPSKKVERLGSKFPVPV